MKSLLKLLKKDHKYVATSEFMRMDQTPPQIGVHLCVCYILIRTIPQNLLVSLASEYLPIDLEGKSNSTGIFLT